VAVTGARTVSTEAADLARLESVKKTAASPDSAPRVPAVLAASSASASATCRRVGKSWQVTAGGRTATVEHCRGLAYLAVLLANPGREVAAVDLAAGPGSTSRRASAEVAEAVEAATASTPGQAILDDQALRRYRARLDELEAIIDRCDAADSPGDGTGGTGGTGNSTDFTAAGRAIAQARAEQDWLRAELRSATGLTGRPRIFATGDERARIAVGKAIRRALTRIADADRRLGALLADSVHTGRMCSYRPYAQRGAA
jgi:hypothetical protein